MSEKQLRAKKSNNAHLQNQLHKPLTHNQKQEGKRPFSISPHRIQLPTQPLTPDNATHLQQTIGNQTLGRLLIQSKLTITPDNATHLQQTIGNQALGRLLIQAKLTLGPTGDKYEQEADAISKQVVNKIADSTKSGTHRQEENPQKTPDRTLQQQEDEEELQMKPHPTISTLQRQEDEEELQMKSLVLRQEEEEIQAKSNSTITGGELSNDIENSVQNAKSNGQTITKPVRHPLEKAFGADFSTVKIHTDAQSDHLNRTIQARAFTTGQDIFFRQGEYNPHHSTGQELLAHELTHTIQQTGGQTQPNLQRWSIKSPISKAGHETLTEESMRLASFEKPKRKDFTYKTDYTAALKTYYEFIKGATFNDDPERLGTGIKFARAFQGGLIFKGDGGEEGKAEKGHQWGTKDRLMGRSHFGDLQFLHGMASKPSETAIVTQRKIMLWAEFCYKIGTGIIGTTEKMGSVTIQPEQELSGSVSSIKKLFHKQRNMTIQEFFGVKNGDVKRQAMGSLLHMLQDTFCASHTERVSAKRKNESVARIKSFHAYPQQDHARHGKADALKSGKTFTEQVAKTAGAQDAVNAGAAVLRFLKQGTAWSAENGPETYLKDVFALTPKATTGTETHKKQTGPHMPGPGRQFRKPLHQEYIKDTSVSGSRRKARLLTPIDEASADYDKMLIYDSTILTEMQSTTQKTLQKDQLTLTINEIDNWLTNSSTKLKGKSYLTGHADALKRYKALFQQDIKAIENEIIEIREVQKTFIQK